MLKIISAAVIATALVASPVLAQTGTPAATAQTGAGANVKAATPAGKADAKAEANVKADTKATVKGKKAKKQKMSSHTKAHKHVAKVKTKKIAHRV